MLCLDRRQQCCPPTLVIVVLFCFCISLRQIVINQSLVVYVPMDQLAYDTLNANESVTSFYDIAQLPGSDYTRLIDLFDFQFDLNADVCHQNRTDIFTIILVHSAPSNFDKRQTIRDTWGSATKHTRVVFLLGRGTHEQNVNVTKEFARYNDIVQGNFVDSYVNMTYKHVMALKYVTYHCTGAKYVLKTDDDVFVNTRGLDGYLSSISPYGARRLLMCKAVFDAKVKRSFRSKWRVSPKVYPKRYYPTYCPGFSIIYSPDVVFKLYQGAQISEYFWIDDVHITGTIAERAKITATSILNLMLNASAVDRIADGDIERDRHLFFLFGSEDLTEDKIRKLWRYVNAYGATSHIEKSLTR